jgi:hypothetical protein
MSEVRRTLRLNLSTEWALPRLVTNPNLWSATHPLRLSISLLPK